MTCTLFKNVAHDYFLQRLPQDEVARMDEHVVHCADCAEFMRICRELSCREFAEFLDDYLEELLAPERRAVFERHLAICRDCRNYLDSYRRVTELSVMALKDDGPIPQLPVPEDLILAVLEARQADPGPDGD